MICEAYTRDLMMIDIDTIWVNKETRKSVLVLWSSDELVTYQAADSQTPVPVRKTKFLNDYEELL